MAAAKNPIDTTPGTKGAVGNPNPTGPGSFLYALNHSPTAQPAKAPATTTPAVSTESAQQILTDQVLAPLGLQSLAAWAWGQYKALGGGTDAINQITLELPEQPAFQQRFPAYKALAAQGEAMSPAEMVSYEQTAKEIMHNAGIPSGFYDTPDELAQFMVNHVSTSELQSRVQLASSAATAAPDVLTQLHSLYGLPNAQGALTAYYLDPTKALPLIQQQFTGAQIGAEATRTGVGQLSADQATHLAQIGVTDAQAASGFGKLGQEAGLFDNQVAGENKIDLNTQIAAQFDNSAAANLRILRRQQARTADFQGNAGESLQSGGVGGLGSVDKSA